MPGTSLSEDPHGVANEESQALLAATADADDLPLANVPVITTSRPPPSPTTRPRAAIASDPSPDSRPSSRSLSPTPSPATVASAQVPPPPSSSSSSSRPTKPQPPRRHSSLSQPLPPGVPRTPRTANRVRFDLDNPPPPASTTPRLGSDGFPSPSPATPVGAGANGHATRPAGARAHSPPAGSSARFGRNDNNPEWLDEEDCLSDSSGRRDSGPRERLLEGIEAPSVRVALAEEEGWDNGRNGGRRGEGEHGFGWMERPKSGLSSAFMNMANSIIGAGIIGQPYAFRQAGLLAGIVLLVGLTVVVDWTIRLIVVNSKLSGADSFQATMEHCFGKAGLIAISIAQWVFAFGGMVAFCVIVGDTIPHVLLAIFPSLPDTPVLWLFGDRRFIIVIFILGLSYPLSLYRDVAKLAKASTLALISMLIIVITVVTQGVRVGSELKGNLSGSLLINDGIFQAVGVISFDHNSLLIYGSLQKPTLDRFACVTHYSTGVSMLACLVMALAGFLTFGDKTKGNVLNNFPADNVMVNVARLCFGLNMLTTLPLEAFVCREVMLNYFFPNAPHNTVRHLAFTTGLVLSATFISLLTCDLGAVFELIGATSACALAYILPPLCYIRLSTRSWRTWLAWACMVFGVTVMVISTVLTIGRMISRKPNPFTLSERLP